MNEQTMRPIEQPLTWQEKIDELFVNFKKKHKEHAMGLSNSSLKHGNTTMANFWKAVAEHQSSSVETLKKNIVSVIEETLEKH
jgi:hypothetical protein